MRWRGSSSSLTSIPTEKAFNGKTPLRKYAMCKIILVIHSDCLPESRKENTMENFLDVTATIYSCISTKVLKVEWLQCEWTVSGTIWEDSKQIFRLLWIDSFNFSWTDLIGRNIGNNLLNKTRVVVWAKYVWRSQQGWHISSVCHCWAECEFHEDVCSVEGENWDFRSAVVDRSKVVRLTILSISRNFPLQSPPMNCLLINILEWEMDIFDLLFCFSVSHILNIKTIFLTPSFPDCSYNNVCVHSRRLFSICSL